MKRILTVTLSLLFCMYGFCSNPIVKVSSGMLQGVKEGKISVFKGIPYASAPIGDLRWKSPQPVNPWEGVLVADHFGNIACQGDPNDNPDDLYTKEFYSGGTPQRSEDCLYLNIWTPSKSVSRADKKLPVAIWIHGGGFNQGYGNEITMDGTEWAKRGVIMVTFNYRLGTMGFLGGNYGLEDQIAALKWVHDNIAAFGGDPDNITVMGQSAGALSIRHLVSCSSSKGFIAKAILQSGSGLAAEKPSEASYSKPSDISSLLESAQISSMDELKDLSYDQLKEKLDPVILSLVLKAFTEGMDLSSILVMSPHWDGKVVDADFDASVYDGSVADIPYLIGYVTADGELLGGESIRRFSHYRNSHSANKAYSYVFTRNLPGDDDDPEKDPGAFHSSELWYMFGTLGRSWRPFTKQDYRLSRQMLDSWTDFCKKGNPGWAPDTAEKPFIQTFDVVK